MLADYWWVFIIVIFVIMLCYPNKVEKMKNTNKKIKKIDFNPNVILTNLPSITSHFVGLI